MMAKKRTHHEADDSKPEVVRESDSSKLSESVVRSAVKALLSDAARQEQKRIKRAQEQKLLSFDLGAEKFVYLGFTFVEIPLKQKLRPTAIALKHSLFDPAEDDVVLFAKDPAEEVEEYLEQSGKGGVKKIMGLKELRTEYGTHEGRRELLSQYDYFLVDKRVANFMQRLLGAPFIAAKKMPLSINMNRDVTAGIKRALNSTSFCPRKGTSTTVKVAKCEFEEDQVVDNVQAVVEGVIARVNGGWSNIQSIVLKTNKSPALPIYTSLPSSG